MIMNDNQSIERGEVVSNGEDQDQDGMNESYIFQTNVLIDCERMTAEAQQTSKSNVSNFFMVDKETHYPNEEAIALLRIPLLGSAFDAVMPRTRTAAGHNIHKVQLPPPSTIAVPMPAYPLASQNYIMLAPSVATVTPTPTDEQHRLVVTPTNNTLTKDISELSISSYDYHNYKSIIKHRIDNTDHSMQQQYTYDKKQRRCVFELADHTCL